MEEDDDTWFACSSMLIIRSLSDANGSPLEIKGSFCSLGHTSVTVWVQSGQKMGVRKSYHSEIGEWNIPAFAKMHLVSFESASQNPSSKRMLGYDLSDLSNC